MTLKMKTMLSILLGVLILPMLWLGAGHFRFHRSIDSTLLPETAVAADNKLKAGMTDPKTGKKIKYWVAPMDPKYIRNEPGKSPMGMDLVPVYEAAGEEKEPASTIRIDSVTIQNMGVRLGTVERKALVKYIRTVGNLTYDETKIYSVNTKFNGWIEQMHVNFEGEQVRKGQPLFDIYSPELVTAQEEFLLAYRQLKNVEGSDYGRIRESSRRLLEASRKRLQYWDLTYKQIMQLERSGQIQRGVTVYSPASGVVTKKNAFAGHYVKAGENQFEIADLSTIWVDVEVYEYELPWVRNGMPAEMELAYVPGERFKGRVLFIYPYLDSKTRTARLRLAFPNSGSKLKPGMYATIYLRSAIAKDSLVIPQEAVIDSGVRKVVFVAKGKGRFEPREVKIGLEGNDNEFQVLDGLQQGEQIVVSAQFMLDSESRLREAIQKMLEARQKSLNTGTDSADDLDMEGITMDNVPSSSQ